MLICPDSRGLRYVDGWTGEAIYERCGKASCAICCLINVKQRARAIRRSKPDRLVTFTLAGEDGVSARENITRVVRKVRGRGYCWQHALSVEPNHEDTGLHVHAWVRGDAVPLDVLNTICAEIGMGHADILPLSFAGPMVYGMKRAQDDTTRASHLRLNGGRLGHHTRGFYLDRQGQPTSLAVALGRRRRRGSSMVRYPPFT